jgi:hypothetical protein
MTILTKNVLIVDDRLLPSNIVFVKSLIRNKNALPLPNRKDKNYNLNSKDWYKLVGIQNPVYSKIYNNSYEIKESLLMFIGDQKYNNRVFYLCKPESIEATYNNKKYEFLFKAVYSNNKRLNRLLNYGISKIAITESVSKLISVFNGDNVTLKMTI